MIHPPIRPSECPSPVGQLLIGDDNLQVFVAASTSVHHAPLLIPRYIVALIDFDHNVPLPVRANQFVIYNVTFHGPLLARGCFPPLSGSHVEGDAGLQGIDIGYYAALHIGGVDGPANRLRIIEISNRFCSWQTPNLHIKSAL